ncbi:MAG: DegT/DnrJ/EryC1/StrS family aminotransferase [Anaerolineae bacterium]|nr:DegT/DnrJ/EryC1/StrS family aminotransferase [Anaerolineae bacterium]
MSRLAIEGGSPVRTEPFPRRILIGEEEIEAVHQLLEKERTQGGGLDRYGGEHVDAYEREFAEYHGVAYATATSSGTAAVHAALGALRLDIAQEVISSPITDPGGVAPILWNNCIPIFADADPETMNVDPQSIAERITERTKAIIVAHLAGQPVDMDPIMEVARAHQIPVIEDCSQAHGALYKGKLVGTIGDIGVFSLMGGKHHTAGGQGGMVITNNEEIYWNAKRFADRGKPFNSEEKKNLFLGLNYRMTELEAVIGRVQLRKLDLVLEQRRSLAAQLAERMADLQAIHMGKVIPHVVPSYWLLLLRVEQERLKVPKEQVARALAAEGIPVDPHYDWIIYETPWFRNRATYGKSGCPWTCPYYGKEVVYEGTCPNARKGINMHMVLRWHEGYTSKEIDDIAAALHKVEQAYLK